MLEPCDGKLSRTVLRGERSRKAPALPGRRGLVMKYTKSKIVAALILIIFFCIVFIFNIRGIWQFGTVRIWVVGLLFSILLGNLITGLILDFLRNCLGTYNPASKPGRYTKFLGGLEAFAYTVALVQDIPSFVVVWLGVKMAGRWKTDEKQKGGINIFLIGNLLNVIFSFLAGTTIKYLNVK